MTEGELRLVLESQRGELKRLDTILMMALAEQRRINAELCADIAKLVALGEAFESRLDKVNVRIAAWTGGLASLWALIQVAQSLGR